jgi:putative phosphoesterase
VRELRSEATDEVLVGVVSDTHGLLRPEAIQALRGSQLILHAGDIGDPTLLDRLMGIAPVRAVRGNVDDEPWARRMPEQTVVEVGGVGILLLHNVHALGRAVPKGVHVVVAGHSHQPRNEVLGGVLFFNPGSAGPRRFSLPVSVGRLRIRGREATGEIVVLG